MRKTQVGVLLTALIVGLAAFVIPTTVANATSDKVTICHATSSVTNPYVELTLAYNAVYGQAGHFSEPGSPNAGHEEDYEGPCKPEDTTTTTPPTTDPEEPTTTVPPTTVPPVLIPPVVVVPPAPPAVPVSEEPTVAG